MNYVQPIKPSYYQWVEDQIVDLLREVIFVPLIDTIEKYSAQEIRLNSNVGALIDAIRYGRIQYQDGQFSGDFSAAIVKELRKIGAKFNKRNGVYTLARQMVPAAVMTESTRYQMNANLAFSIIHTKINEIQKNLYRKIQDRPIDATDVISRIDLDFEPVAEKLKIAPRITEASREFMKKQYSQDMTKWIMKFSEEEVFSLRRKVEQNALQGFRFDRLIDSIKARYSVSQSKARFLARQETGLFLAKFREQRFRDAGVQQYRWSTSNDERVRDSHAELDGKVFFYDSPPNTAGKGQPARYNNPGQDYQCRCVDVPIIRGLEK